MERCQKRKSDTLTSDDEKKMKDLFETYDEDHNNRLSIEEFKTLWKVEYGKELDDQTIQKHLMNTGVNFLCAIHMSIAHLYIFVISLGLNIWYKTFWDICYNFHDVFKLDKKFNIKTETNTM